MRTPPPFGSSAPLARGLASLARGLAPLASLAVLTFALGCNKQPEPIPNEKPADAPKTAPTSSSSPLAHGRSSDAGTGTPGSLSGDGPEELGWEAPASWVNAPNPNPMRKATYKIPKAGGDPEDAELTVSAASGGVEANVKRWEGQFGDAKAKTDARTVNGLKVTVVEIKGKLASGGGMMGQPATAPKDGQMLLGAIVDAGARQHFFKMVGSEKTVSGARKDFDKFVSTLRAK